MAIWGAYLSIPTILLFFASRQRNIPFRHMFGLFGLFILSCGFTHFLDWYTFHTPMYRLAGLVKLITAVASWGTVMALIPLTPRALAMRSPADLEKEVEARTRELQREIEVRQRVEKLLLERQSEIEALNQGLEERVRERTAELQSANEELESFCYSVSHDLRQPLRAIDGFSFAVAQDASDRLVPEEQELLNRVRSATKRMDVLITALLKLSRVYRAELKVERINLTEMVWSVLSELKDLDPGRQIDLDVQPGLFTTMDAGMARVVLFNLLENAWKFTGRTERPRIEVGRDGDEFFVRDNGAGFESQYVHKLFLPFERLHKASEFDGSGVGLATVERIVRRHGGSVRAEGKLGEGAAIYFTIPDAGPDGT